MFVNVYRLISAFIFLIILNNCGKSQQPKDKIDSRKKVQVTSQPVQFANLINEVIDENGRISALTGFTSAALISDGILTGDEKKSVLEDNLYSFSVPQGLIAEYSKPILVAGAALYSNIECDKQEFFPTIPKISDLPESDGDITACIRIKNHDSSEQKFVKIPHFSLIHDINKEKRSLLHITNLKTIVNGRDLIASWDTNNHVQIYRIKYCSSIDCSQAECVNFEVEKATVSHSYTFADDGNYHVCLSGFADEIQSDWTISEVINITTEESEITVSDTTPPENPRIIINGGSERTKNQEVKVTVSSYEADQIYMTNTQNCLNGGEWQIFNGDQIFSWALAQTNALATVYVKTRDEAGNESECVSRSIIHDNQPPSGLSFSINEGATYTNNDHVTLHFSAKDAKQVYISEIEGCGDDGSWATFAKTLPWRLPERNTQLNLYVKFRDSVNNETECLSDGIIHDDISPFGLLSINNGSAFTNSQTIDLKITSETATQIYVTNQSGCLEGGEWESLTNLKKWQISKENSENYVFMKLKDEAGNLSNCLMATVRHDSIPPSVDGIKLEDGISTANSKKTPTLSWGLASDINGSGISHYEIKIGTTKGSADVLPYTYAGNFGNFTFNLATPMIHGKTYYPTLRAIDKAGNSSLEIEGDGFIYGWYQSAYIKADDVDGEDSFGQALALLGDTLAVGMPYEDSGSSTLPGDETIADAGAAYVYKLVEQDQVKSWKKESYLKAIDIIDQGDRFGFSLSLSGNLLAISAPYEDSNQKSITNDLTNNSISADNSVSDSGAVYIFARSQADKLFSKSSYIKAPNGGEEDAFGYSVAISGNILAIGAPFEDNENTAIVNNGEAIVESAQRADSGAVYIFELVNNSWVFKAYIKAPNAGASDQFGKTVALSDSYLVVGAPGEDSSATEIASDNNDKTDSGAVYIFSKSDEGLWVFKQYIKPSELMESHQFGSALALENHTLAIGSPGDGNDLNVLIEGADLNTLSMNNNRPKSGAVWLYKLDDSLVWQNTAYIKSPNSDTDDQFGRSLAVTKENTLVVGAPNEDHLSTGISHLTQLNQATDYSAENEVAVGAAYVFSYGSSKWRLSAYVKGSNSEKSDKFGNQVSAYSNTFVCSASGEANSKGGVVNGLDIPVDDAGATASGAVYIFAH